MMSLIAPAHASVICSGSDARRSYQGSASSFSICRILMEECWKQEELSILNFKSTRGFENPALAQQKNLPARAAARQIGVPFF